ncbi:hypothetical protein P9152_11885 [Bacillus subtilis]|uniref:hypothetical protein n=1 Tax=Bacillus subtilis TaxID=1423 RepID=UPI0004A586FF|nr:hypothetical protein [Bacillus subtilis]AXC53165.1 hypothetical protein DQ231_10010 [Bacillus spizizenii]MBA5716641.1 hypothetical protein [Bacillus subtilis]MDK1003272.1 hypothetical protein [Bacillus subtilis]MEC3618544.1 hypothetical protein [Bacillus subtilis]MEC3635518.1 hypothetical protein [Bacillus subtilis]
MLNGSGFKKGGNAIKNLVLLSSFFGVVLSIIGLLFGVLTDFFISGIARLMGVLAGLLVLLSLKSRNTEMQTFIVSSSTALGIIGAGVLYLPSAIVNVLIGFKLNKKLKDENTKEQI